MKVLLLQLDGKTPNIALMRVASHHRTQGHDVEFSRTVYVGSRFDRIYASTIFTKTAPKVDLLRRYRPDSIVGGTGIDPKSSLEAHGIHTKRQDYSIYPEFRQSIGFTQRGCRLKCSFCVVPEKEGDVSEENTVADVWRGEPWPRELLLLDNDFFGQPNWRDRIREIRDGKFKVSFNQGINARFLTDEAAEALASVDYRDDSMKDKRIYTAWDNRKDEQRLFDGLNRLVKYGVKPDHIMVYMLIGYWPGETHEDRDHRRKKLRDFGARPYPMAYVRSRELVGFQRWIIGAYDKRVSWTDFEAAGYEPRKLNFQGAAMTAQAAARG